MTQPWGKALRNGSYQGSPDFVKIGLSLFEDHWLGEKNALDAGCGNGIHTILLAEMGFNVTALDISEGVLKDLEKRISGEPYQNQVNLVHGSLDNLPFDDNYFDVALSTSVIHHGTYDQRNRWLSELARVNKEYGLVILGVLSRNDRRFRTGSEVEDNTFINIEDTFDSEVPHHFYSADELIEQLNRLEYYIHKQDEIEEKAATHHNPFMHLYVIAQKTMFLYKPPHSVH